MTSIVQGDTLVYQQDGHEQTLAVGTPAWYSWLETASTFAFVSDHGTFTARRERSGHKRGGWYWKAYRKQQGKLSSTYLGKPEGLTLDRLNAAAQRLAHARVSDSQATTSRDAAPPAPGSSQDDPLPPLLATNEVGGQRGTMLSSDLSEIPSDGFMKIVLFQPSLPEPDRPLSRHPAQKARWLHRYWAYPLAVRGLHRTRWGVSTFPCTPSPCPGHSPGHSGTMGALFPRGSRRLGNPIVSRLCWSVLRCPFRWVPLSLRVAGVWCLLSVVVHYGPITPHAP